METQLRVSVFGLGYVGAVTAACLAQMGHQIIGVDIDKVKVDKINGGYAPVEEPGLSDLITEMVTTGRLRASTNAQQAVLGSDVSMICVGTPSRPNGGLDLQYVRRVVWEIGQYLAGTDKEHGIVLRSTVLPGTSARCLRELQKSAGRKAGLEVVYNPEFLREGSALQDFFDPPYTIIGTGDGQAADWITKLYERVLGKVIVTSWGTAELLKYACNAFHALKIVFANEMGRIAKAMDVDAFELMNLVSEDTKLNISAAYLRPGFAYGGSCLPKDLRALITEARFKGIELPTLESLPRSNSIHLATAIKLIRECTEQAGSNNIGFLGLVFKEATDDLRESPSLELIERLQAYGYCVTAYDSHINLASLCGSSKFFVDRQLPNLPDILTDNLERLISESPVLVVGHIEETTADLVSQWVEDEQFVVDLTGGLQGCGLRARYHGLCW